MAKDQPHNGDRHQDGEKGGADAVEVGRVVVRTGDVGGRVRSPVDGDDRAGGGGRGCRRRGDGGGGARRARTGGREWHPSLCKEIGGSREQVPFRVVSDAWLIEPAGPLRGEVEVRGSKNAVTKHMVAALLGEGPSTITNVPEVGDVDITASILTAIGASVEREGSSITVVPPAEVDPRVPLSFSGLNRIPVLLL